MLLRLVSPRWLPLAGVTLLVIATAAPLTASVCPAPEIFGQIVNPHVEGTVIFWDPLISYETLTLRVSAPCGDIVRTFKEGELPFFDIREITREVDGRYAYELTARPRIDPAVQDQLTEVRGTPQEQLVVLTLWDKGLLPRGPFSQSGTFHVVRGLIEDPNQVEKGAGAQAATSDSGGLSARFPGSDGGVEVAGSSSIRNISAADFVIIDDLIVDGSACIGFDCVNGESFGFDTVRLKENNLRIKFDDTSTAASFPRNDWQITANDSANGGQSKFSIDDISGSRTPFTIEANARNHSIYVDDGGRLGLRTSTPSVEIHTVDGDTPALRLQQDGSSGFAPQTWDVAGNETTFFIRDVTNGSTLPFRIQPGASSNAIFIASDDNVGLGTSSPSEALHVRRTDGTSKLLVEEASGTEASRVLLDLTNNGQVRYVLRDTSADGEDWEVSNLNSGFNISLIGSGGPEVVVAQRDPSGVTNVMTVDGDIAAVDFNMTSSRELKTGLTGLDVQEVLDRLVRLDLFEWSFKSDASNIRHVGPMAEDFLQIFDLGSDSRHISLVDANGVALAAIQGLNQRLQEKEREIQELKELVTKFLETAQPQEDGSN